MPSIHALIQVLVVLIILGAVVWLVQQSPIAVFFKNCIYVIVAIVALIYTLHFFGLY